MTDTGIYGGIAHADYLATPSVSQSSLKTLLDCPARFAWEREHPREVGDAADLGSVVHDMLLGGGQDIVVVDADDWRTKAAQEQRKEARAEGRVAVLASAYATAEQMHDAVLSNDQAAALLGAEGGAEQSMFWDRAVNGVTVPLRGRIDKAAVISGRTVLVDVKSARSAAPGFFASQVVNYGYAIQQQCYIDGWSRLTGEEPEFAFVVVENVEPYLTVVYTLDETFLAYGAMQYQKALDLYVDCTMNDRWPAYPSGMLAAPRWLERQMREEAAWAEPLGGDPWGQG